MEFVKLDSVDNIVDIAQYAHSFQLVIDGGRSMSSGSARSSLFISQMAKTGDHSRGMIFAPPSLFVEQGQHPFLQNIAHTLLILSSLVSSSSSVDVVMPLRSINQR